MDLGEGPVPAARPALSDARLIAALRAGDARAFEAIHERYRPRLVRFARRILGASHGAVAEDVVQEALLRAYRALLRDERHVELRPWLHRLVRNCCLDELSRGRPETVELAGAGDLAPGPAGAEPAVAAERRARLRQLIDDLAVLPENQRHALLRREIDGATHAQLAAEMGLSEPAARSLVHRARVALTRLEVGRGTPCAEIREDLVAAHDRRRRPTARALRHLAACGPCRDFRAALRTERRALALLVPGPLALVALGAGVGALKGGVASKAGAGMAATAVALAGVAGGMASAPEIFRAGDAAPVALRSPALPAHGVARGTALPRGTAVVRRTVALRAGVRAHPDVTVGCPAGLAVADLLPPRGARVDAAYGPGTIVGLSATARVRLSGVPLRQDARATVAILCKRPDAGGSPRWSGP
jgi:RNA polymerase sigma factor (sigma-70 family)